MLVTDARRARLPPLDLITEAAAGGVDAIYLRDIDAAGDNLAALAHQIRDRAATDIALMLNGDPRRALMAGTGLHLRERDMTPSAARTVLGPDLLIGRSVHAPESATAAVGADFVLAGHVYSSASKPGLTPLGLAGLAAIVAVAPCPVIAIGGIAPERVAEVVQTGARGIAIIGAIATADDPRAAAASLRAALDRALHDRELESHMDESSDATGSAPMVDIVVNGEIASVPSDATVHDFLAGKRMTDAMAIVERNGQIVPRGQYADTPLQAGDRLEVVHAVGGG